MRDILLVKKTPIIMENQSINKIELKGKTNVLFGMLRERLISITDSASKRPILTIC